MNDKLKSFFRFGLTAKGIVYFLLGGLFLFASRTTGKSGVLDFVAGQTFGQVLLALLGIGLLAYSIFRWYWATEDPEEHGEDAEGYSKRVGYAASGTAYGALAVSAFSILLGSRSRGSGGSGQKEQIMGELLTTTWGQWLVGILGVILAIVAIFHLYRAFTEKYAEKINSSALSSKIRKVYHYTAKAGLSARSVVFFVLGYLLFKSVTFGASEKVSGLQDVFQFLKSSEFPWAATLIAVGLAAYGVYMLVVARYRTFKTNM